MKRIICSLLTVILCLMIVTSGIGCGRKGFIKTPSDSSAMKGRDYLSVVASFLDRGFRNIKTERIEDLIDDGQTTEGAVEEVLVGGDINYSPNEWVPVDTEVVIRYHAFPYVTPGKVAPPPVAQSVMEQRLLLALQGEFGADYITFNEESNTYEIIPEGGDNFMAVCSSAKEGSEEAVAAWKEVVESAVTLSKNLTHSLGPGYSVALFDTDKKNTLLLIVDGEVILDFLTTEE